MYELSPHVSFHSLWKEFVVYFQLIALTDLGVEIFLSVVVRAFQWLHSFSSVFYFVILPFFFFPCFLLSCSGSRYDQLFPLSQRPEMKVIS